MENIPPPNVVDILAFIVVAIGTFQGFRRRLSGELAHLISVVAAFTLGLYFFRPLGSWLCAHTRLSEQAAHMLAFIIMIIVAVAAMVLLQFVLKRIMKVVFEETVDKTGGVLAGFVRSAIFVIIVFLIMNLWPHDYLNRLFGEESVIGTVIIRYMPSLR